MSAYRLFKAGSLLDLASSSNSAAPAKYSATLRMTRTSANQRKSSIERLEKIRPSVHVAAAKAYQN
jgi:hypothetical protein